MGVMVGEVTSTSALVQVRLTRSNQLLEGDVPGVSGTVEFILEAEDPVSESGSGEIIERVEASAETDFIARAAFRDLTPGTRYRCRVRTGIDEASLSPGPGASFKTFPGPTETETVRFVVVTGMNYAKFHGDDRIDREQHLVKNSTALPVPYSGPDKHLGYPALKTILQIKPDFFVGTGDNVYYDTPDNPRAKTVTELRRKWHEQFIQPRYIQLFASVPTFWEIDDHDYRIDDCDNTGDYDPSPELGRRMMLEQLPVGASGEEGTVTYRTHRISRDLQIWLTENRMYRSPNAMADGPEKSIWGAEQKAWLKKTLEKSDATFKLLISPTPMVGPDDLRKKDNHTNIGGFQYERGEFFTWLQETGIAKKNFYIVCGDRHWQYHAVSPEGIEEFSCGALIDQNSRLGRKSGDPASTDPDGRVRQLYLQEPASGGFLLISVIPAAAEKPASLNFDFCDENGIQLYGHQKTAW
jgi:alkaline phosphatase/alkaline phosphatase D